VLKTIVHDDQFAVDVRLVLEAAEGDREEVRAVARREDDGHKGIRGGLALTASLGPVAVAH